ncbi:LLM class flavin-dependent oxidoreductase [Domibacillus sp. A3M-37]|uniref:LLM class flavin-dependent oxidoreductase n=1 Tax=Domibacillus TaxID=1433999 RepID=UPI0020B63A7A|nr:LLM class flavin-dependent oxidoreductase [Domibacillus sp. A3M-37]MCP3764751.1 LLM class flavin-dependent oxidoreductase [Domibacillus sp. A3M-37]
MAYKISLLDQSPIYENETAFDSLQYTIQLAQKAEKWGYHRFWVSEHHNAEQLAGSSPEVLMSYLLAKTKQIRIGSGGIMLQHYSPYKVAENFNVLSSLEPGRVDLGVGKAPGGLPISTKALQYGTVNDGNDFEERLTFLHQILEKKIPNGHPLSGVQARPEPPLYPEYYLLGASEKSAELAAKLGWNFVFAKFINSDISVWEEAAQTYRQLKPNGKLIMAISVFAADSQKAAEERVTNQSVHKVYLKSGRSVTVQSFEQAEQFGQQSGEEFDIQEQKASIVAGTATFIQEVLNHYHQAYGVDEFVLHTPIEERKARHRSFQLLSPSRLYNEKREEYVS